MQVLQFKYKFQFEDEQQDEFLVEINEETLEHIINEEAETSDWTALEYNQCSHCPLNPAEHPHCPIAKSIAHLAEHFKDKASYLRAKITVETENRTYYKETDLQSGLFSIFGLIMATSQCPYMDFLKPMARFHLPFSSLDESTIRSSSMYLLKQYFEAKDGKEPDLNLTKLEKRYEDINLVNEGILSRVRSLGTGDSKSNAMVTLYSIAQVFSMELSSDLSGVRKYFK